MKVVFKESDMDDIMDGVLDYEEVIQLGSQVKTTSGEIGIVVAIGDETKIFETSSEEIKDFKNDELELYYEDDDTKTDTSEEILVGDLVTVPDGREAVVTDISDENEALDEESDTESDEEIDTESTDNDDESKLIVTVDFGEDDSEPEMYELAELVKVDDSTEDDDDIDVNDIITDDESGEDDIIADDESGEDED